MARSLVLATLVSLASAVIGIGCEQPPRDPGPTTSSKTAAVEAPSWPTAIDQGALSALDAESKAAVARSPVPVLVPNRPELLAVGKVMAEEHWFAFHASKDGVTVHVQGTRIVHKHDDVAPAKGNDTLRGVPAFVTRNEAIWTGSWREHGISYALDVECGEPSDARCATDAILRDLARDLVFVGGQGGAR